jgi:hypothetical protein
MKITIDEIKRVCTADEFPMVEPLFAGSDTISLTKLVSLDMSMERQMQIASQLIAPDGFISMHAIPYVLSAVLMQEKINERDR